MKRYAVHFRIVTRSGDPWRLDKHYRTYLFARMSAAAYAHMGWPSRIIDHQAHHHGGGVVCNIPRCAGDVVLFPSGAVVYESEA